MVSPIEKLLLGLSKRVSSDAFPDHRPFDISQYYRDETVQRSLPNSYCIAGNGDLKRTSKTPFPYKNDSLQGNLSNEIVIGDE